MKYPKQILIDGALILEEKLKSSGFEFQFQTEGNSSGGTFATGIFVKNKLSIELHFRQSLGLVTYKMGNDGALHQNYMSALGVSDKCFFPDFPSSPIDSFKSLLHDLQYADDFLLGSCEVLKKAIEIEKKKTEEEQEKLMYLFTGDVARIEKMRIYFYERKYEKVLEISNEIVNKKILTHHYRKMIKISKERTI